MKHTAGILIIGLLAGAALGIVGSRIVTAQPTTAERTPLLTTDLVGVAGYEVHMWRTDIEPEMVGPKHYHSGTECTYVLEGSMILEEAGTPTLIKSGEAHCAPPKTMLVLRNASDSEPAKSVVTMISPKGVPIDVMAQ
jgi:quercetin dioxygenase-like cupin family protein